MAVGLQLAGKNDFVRVQEDINDNLIKLDEAIDFNLLATLGIEYGGILNNTDAKVAGKAYYDTTGKKLYKCIANTNLSYADAGYFEAISNNDLLGKLQNLSKDWKFVASISVGRQIINCGYKKSIIIPRHYKELMCRWSASSPIPTVDCLVDIFQLESLTIGQKMLEELYLVFDGKDDESYYFHVESGDSYIDNAVNVYSR